MLSAEEIVIGGKTYKTIGKSYGSNEYIKKGEEYRITVGFNFSSNLALVTPNEIQLGNGTKLIKEIYPVTDSVCKIRYDFNDIVEYVKTGDVFRYTFSGHEDMELAVAIEALLTVVSFDYNEIVCDVSSLKVVTEDDEF